MMKYWLAVVVLGAVVTLSSKPRPNRRFIRGVDPAKLPFYRPAKEFRCLDSSGIISYNWINDDYCDCRDGSDEPGTSACPNNVFYCINTNFRPHYILSSRVNDGVCDCCDGSDEYSHHVQCTNNCKELGERMRQEEEVKSKLYAEGYFKYLDYCKLGAKIRTEKEVELEQLELEMIETERIKQELGETKNTKESIEKELKDIWQTQLNETRAEAEEEDRKLATEAFRLIDVNTDGRITSDELKTFFGVKDGDLKGSEGHLQEMFNLNEPVTPEEFVKDTWMKVKDLYEEKLGHKGQPSNGDDADDDDDDAEKAGVEANEQYDDKTKEAIEDADAARKSFAEQESRFNEVKNNLERTRNLLDSDSGEESEFLPLYNQCFDLIDREYLYTLCPLQHATQKSKDGSGHTILGKWGSWISKEQDKYSIMYYDNGNGCWNGPNRSVKVYLECGSSEELFSVSEPNRCEYDFRFKTSAVCRTPPPSPKQPRHDPGDL